MNVVNTLKLATTVGKKWFVKNAPDILTGTSIGLSLLAVGLAIPATLKAEKKIQNKQEEMDILATERGEPIRQMTRWEKVKAGWTCFVPTLLAIGGSIASDILARNISVTRFASMAAAASLSEKKLQEQLAAVESLNESNQKKVHEKRVDNYLEENPVNSGFIEDTGTGDTIFVDIETGRKFKASYKHVADSFKRISDNLVNEQSQSFNDLYAELGLSESNSGHSLGWTASDWPLNPYLDERMTETGEKYYVISYAWSVLYDFRNY